MLGALTAFDPLSIFLVFVRVGTALAFFPGFSAAYVPMRIRLVLALALSVVLTPVVTPEMPPQSDEMASTTLLILSEAAIGAFLGIFVRIIVSALQIAGSFVALFGGMANAMVQDVVVEQQSATIANFFSIFGLMILFVTDLHHLMLEGLAESYTLFPAGHGLPIDTFAEATLRATTQSFEIGLKLAAPTLLATFSLQVILGLLGKLMPQLPSYFFGMPIQVGLNLWVLMVTLAATMFTFRESFIDAVLPVLGS